MTMRARIPFARAVPLDNDALRFVSVRGNDPRVLAIRRYIREQFARHYGARIHDFMPLQLAMVRGGEIKAAAGVRTAACSSLFLEHYLDRPCEEEISAFAGTDRPARCVVAEVGNLAATESGAARALFVHIAAVARRDGLVWLMCNATSRVEAIFRFMKLPFSRLREADRQRVPDPEAWGSYYDTPSHVMAAPVAGIVDAMVDHDPVHFALAERRAHRRGSAPAPARHTANPGAPPLRSIAHANMRQTRSEPAHDSN